MDDKQTAEHIRGWVERWESLSPFSWPTDGCGYEQHCRFVEHRNRVWGGGNFMDFVLDYADKLERGEIPRYGVS